MCVCGVCVCVCVHVCVVCMCGVCVCVRGAQCVVCILQGQVWVCVCVDLFSVHKQAWHAGIARCIFEKCTVKNYFVANNTLCQSSDLLNHFVGLQK